METPVFDGTALLNLFVSLILGVFGFGEGGWLENLFSLVSLFGG